MQNDKTITSKSAQAIKDFLTIKKSNGLTEKTLHHYGLGIEMFEEWRTKPIKDLTQVDMAEYVQKLRDIPLKPKSVELRLHPVKSFITLRLLLLISTESSTKSSPSLSSK